MKARVTKFKSLAVALKELEPFVRNGAHLRSGRPFASMDGMRSREALGNWLICAALKGAAGKQLTFSSDPTGGDGFIIDEATGNGFPTEHVMVASADDGDIERAIAAAVKLKVEKGGAAYAAGKNLVVFIDTPGGRPWYPNRVARALSAELPFASAWVIGLQSSAGEIYRYSVTSLDVAEGDAPTFAIQIAPDFSSWAVEVVQ